jgi:hypothetical protein
MREGKPYPKVGRGLGGFLLQEYEWGGQGAVQVMGSGGDVDGTDEDMCGDRWEGAGGPLHGRPRLATRNGGQFGWGAEG